MKANSSMQIGVVAKKTGSSIYTVRYYEKMGLIQKPPRTEGGFRLYPAATVDKILFIKKAQSFGLTLEEIQKIMCCGDKGLEPCCAMVTKIFENKILEFESKIGELQKTKKRLKILLAGWTKRG
jgi:MerR family transcriptional regulator, copper efflux regulator